MGIREISQAWIIFFNRENKYNAGFYDSYSQEGGPYIKLVGEHADRKEFVETERRVAKIVSGEPERGIANGIDEGKKCLVGIIKAPEKPTLVGIERFRNACKEAGFTKVKVDEIV